MKHLPIYNEAYRRLLEDFSLYLERLGYNQGSRTAMPSCLQEFFYWLEQLGINEIDQVTPTLIRAHRDYLEQRPNYNRPGNLSESMVSHHVYAIRTFMNYQQHQGRLEINPFGVLSFPSPEYAPRQVLTRVEIQQLYGVAETMKDKAILALFYGCGLRRTEAIKLNSNDISFRHQLLYVRSGKGMKRRVIPMCEAVAKDLEYYYLYERSLQQSTDPIQSENAFILNKEGRRMKCYWRRLKYLVHQAKLPPYISLHHLRHSIATHLLESGLSIEQVRDFLGHKYLESTQVYTRISSRHRSAQAYESSY